MTPAAARRRLPALAARIERTKNLLDKLYAERLQAFEALTVDGASQQEIAELAQVTSMAVANQLWKARQSRNAVASPR